MSKATDQKVEDVLSSVRRLVSSELPRNPRSEAPSGPGALMLTEAHRIESSHTEKSASRSLEDRIAELEAAVGGQEEDFEPDGSEDQTQHRPNRIVYTRPPASAEEASVRKSSLRLSQIALIETGPANDDGAAAAEDAPSFRRTSEPPAAPPEKRPDEAPMVEDEAPMAEDVPPLDPVSADVAAFTNPDDVVQKIEARIVSGRPISEPLQLVEPAPKPEAPAAEAEPDDFDTALTAAVAASLAATVNKAEAGDGDHAVKDVLSFDEFNLVDLNGSSSDPEVTAAELLAGDDAAATPAEAPKATMPHPASAPLPAQEAAPATPTESLEKPAPAEAAPAAETEAPAEAVPAAADAPETATETAAASLDALPDDEAMRLLVARLIREELAGDLGERITRNMRKLVRREIKRALSSKDLT